LIFTQASVPRRQKIELLIRGIQERICAHVESAEKELGGKELKFREDVWLRDNPGEGGGITRVIQNGSVFEKAGVNVSAVSGTLPPRAVAAMKADHADILAVLAKRPANAQIPFFACGVSVVIHAHNPFVPTVHCNYRYCSLFLATCSDSH
jgi:coproporphyrinogen III oxidase